MSKNSFKYKTLMLLHHNSVYSTFDFRAQGVCSPASAIHSLRQDGWEIKKYSRSCRDTAGVMHHGIAHYYLLGFTGMRRKARPYGQKNNTYSLFDLL